MCLLKRIVHYEDKKIELETQVEAGAWYLDEHGQMPTWVTLEMMAQAAAAYSGMERICEQQPPRIGVLLGARTLVAYLPTVPAGTMLHIKAEQTFRDRSGMGAIDAQIFVRNQAGESLLASATLKVYELGENMTLADLNS
jgi:predicted hotdog family 3-hydroxylacyl-ACP dehydratase